MKFVIKTVIAVAALAAIFSLVQTTGYSAAPNRAKPAENSPGV